MCVCVASSTPPLQLMSHTQFIRTNVVYSDHIYTHERTQRYIYTHTSTQSYTYFILSVFCHLILSNIALVRAEATCVFYFFFIFAPTQFFFLSSLLQWAPQ